jgi:hypothetical protein
MSKPWWPLARVVACSTALVLLTAGRAPAQTVIVRNAPAGATVQVQLNGAPPLSATASAQGQATVSPSLPAGTTESVVSMFIDVCVRQVFVRLNSGPLQAPAEVGCTRTNANASFLLGPSTTFVVDLAGSTPSVRIRQGPPFASWLVDGVTAGQAGVVEGGARRGLLVFAGGGLASFGHAVSTACGNASCTGGDLRFAAAGGATFWATPNVGVQIALLKPTAVSTSGSDSAFSFDSSLATRALVLAGNLGGRVGGVRLYGQAGRTYQHATFTQTEGVDGATQSLVLETSGWGWLFGVGAEGWVNRVLAVYGEGQYLGLRGNNTSGGEGRMDDHVIALTGGVRLRLF